MGQIVVVGSANIDYVVPVERLPTEGETVMGGDYFLHPGGKGANQAVAAARLGATVAFVGAVGRDEPAELLRSSMAQDGIDLSALRGLSGVRTGVAFIAVSSSGANQIIVSSGANMMVNAQMVRDSSALIQGAEIVLLQHEIDESAVELAASVCQGRVILNPAPARPISSGLLDQVDILVPNEHELGLLTKSPTPTSVAEVERLARQIVGPEIIIVTLGAQGALVCSGAESVLVGAPKVAAVDTTAAGDTFCGALAAGLLAGYELDEAVKNAVWAAALSVMKPGAQGSMPTAIELEKFIA